MLIGTMNNPSRPLNLEFDRAKEAGFDFVDLTYEYPYAHPSREKWGAVLGMIKGKGLPLVGHTDYDFKVATDHSHTRLGIIKDLEEAIEFLAQAGARAVTIHFDEGKTLQHPDRRVENHIYVLGQLAQYAKTFNVQIMLENSPKGKIHEFEAILKALPQVGLHLDVGHALVTGGFDHIERLLNFGRLAHVHVSDNDGKSDLHLPLASSFKNNISWETIIGMIKDSGYDKTITLEVFSPERALLNWSANYLRSLWG